MGGQVGPSLDPVVFRANLQCSVDILAPGEGEYIDLVALHGINRRCRRRPRPPRPPRRPRLLVFRLLLHALRALPRLDPGWRRRSKELEWVMAPGGPHAVLEEFRARGKARAPMHSRRAG
jgi:hypothetical protein